MEVIKLEIRMRRVFASWTCLVSSRCCRLLLWGGKSRRWQSSRLLKTTKRSIPGSGKGCIKWCALAWLNVSPVLPVTIRLSLCIASFSLYHITFLCPALLWYTYRLTCKWLCLQLRMLARHEWTLMWNLGSLNPTMLEHSSMVALRLHVMSVRAVRTCK